jgi:hypothetical protein
MLARMQIDWRVLPSPMSASEEGQLPQRNGQDDAKRAIAQKAVQLILCEEREPAHAVALVLSKLDVDVDWDLVLGDLVAVEELSEELPLVLPFGEQVGGEARRIGKAGLI